MPAGLPADSIGFGPEPPSRVRPSRAGADLVSEDWRPGGRVVHRGTRALVALLLSCSLVGLMAACGFNAQTNQPYTPADGTNADIGTDGVLKIRNLVVISRAEGEGIVSASLIGNAEDQLTGITVAPFLADGSDEIGRAHV